MQNHREGNHGVPPVTLFCTTEAKQEWQVRAAEGVEGQDKDVGLCFEGMEGCFVCLSVCLLFFFEMCSYLFPHNFRLCIFPLYFEIFLPVSFGTEGF